MPCYICREQELPSRLPVEFFFLKGFDAIMIPELHCVGDPASKAYLPHSRNRDLSLDHLGHSMVDLVHESEEVGLFNAQGVTMIFFRRLR